jgi:hypothetical protein
VQIVLKFWSLNLLELSGLDQACNGIDFRSRPAEMKLGTFSLAGHLGCGNKGFSVTWCVEDLMGKNLDH